MKNRVVCSKNKGLNLLQWSRCGREEWGVATVCAYSLVIQ